MLVPVVEGRASVSPARAATPLSAPNLPKCGTLCYTVRLIERHLAAHGGIDMQRAAIYLAIGIGIGAAGVSYYHAHRAPAPTAEAFDSLLSPAADDEGQPSTRPRAEPSTVEALGAGVQSTAQRAALYAAAARADVSGINAMLTQAASFSDPAARAFAIDVLITRYGELDPGGAVAAAARVDISPETLTSVYYAWLKSSPTAALAALSKLDDAKASMIASGLIARLGNDDALVDRVIGALPARLAANLMTTAIFRVARDSPTEAIKRAERIADPSVRASAVSQVLYLWAQRDPRAALEYVDRLPAQARRDAFNGGMWSQIATAEPELLLERIDTLPADQRPGLEQMALQSLAQRDPQAALARLAAIPRGEQRQQFLQAIARSFGERDAAGALAWARSLQPPEPGVVVSVIQGVAAKDPLHAIELAAEIQSPLEQMQALQTAYMYAAAQDPTLFAPLLERALALPNTGQKQMIVQSLTASWAVRDPAKATEWLLANGSRAPLDVVTQVASQYARLDPARAASYATRMPSEARGAWLRGVASSYAQTDPRGALDWVEQFRGSAEYDDAALAVVQSAAQLDPPAAARVLESIGREDYRRTGVGTVAMTWASRDPAAAASWAAGLRDPTTRMTAVNGVAQVWATQDAPSAQAWALSQPSGQARDSALMAIISTTSRLGTPDASLLSALSSEQTRIAAVQASAFGVAQRDPQAAHAFIDANVADQFQRDRLHSFISQMPNMRPGIVGPGSPGFFPSGVAVQQGVAMGPGMSPAVINGARGVQYPPPPTRPTNGRQ
jgi:hypothetical protein